MTASRHKTIELAQDPKLALESAAQVLRQGGVAALPTDTVYGLAALAGDAAATDKLFALKQRPESVPIAVLVADVAQALQLVAPPDRSARLLMQKFWPGPLTLVLPAAPGLAAVPVGGAVPSGGAKLPTTVGVRCPDHNFISELATEVGPLATTSANLHGQPVCLTAAEIAAAFSDAAPAGSASAAPAATASAAPAATASAAPAATASAATAPAATAANLELIIDGGQLTASASSVVACNPNEELQLLREGAITEAQLRKALKTHHRVS